MDTSVDDAVPEPKREPESEPVPEAVSAGRKRSPAIAAGLSFLWPGLGQFFLGRRRAAAAFAVPAFVLAIVAAIQLSQGALMFAASLWDQSYFVAVAGAAVVFGAWRILAVGHAFLSASEKGRPRPLEFAAVAALLALVLAMHGLFVAGAWAWYDTSVSIQNNDIFAVGSTSPGATTPASEPTPVDTSSFVPYGVTPSGSPAPTQSPNPNRMTFLLIGSDFVTGRTHSLTDTLMLVSIDLSTEKVSFVSVPRDTSNFDLYYGGWVGPTFKINTLLNSAGTKYLRSPDPPMKTLENEIGFLVGVPVNYYAALDLNGFAKMVDALGGIDIVNQRAINDPSTGIVMAPGPVHLDGATAMLYVRSRENGGSDYLRSARQQTLLVALEHKVVSPAGLGQLGTLLSLAGKTIGTDFPLSKARDYVSAAQRVSSIESCVLGPPYSYHPDTSTTGGTWTSRLDMARVANLSVEMFGKDSRYYGQPGVVPAPCGK
ncbi:MAG: LCP family protein [Candidatus Limnocylindrales bacterium]|jgi:LCP family protein required for cell wall assembly